MARTNCFRSKFTLGVGATLRQDLDDNATLYGKKLENRDIVTTGVRAPKAAAKLMSLLNK
jgi:lipid-binding SYLF domain-containing protein